MAYTGNKPVRMMPNAVAVTAGTYRLRRGNSGPSAAARSNAKNGDALFSDCFNDALFLNAIRFLSLIRPALIVDVESFVDDEPGLSMGYTPFGYIVRAVY